MSHSLHFISTSCLCTPCIIIVQYYSSSLPSCVLLHLFAPFWPGNLTQPCTCFSRLSTRCPNTGPLWHTSHDKRRPSVVPICPFTVAFSCSLLASSVPEIHLHRPSPLVTANPPAWLPLYWPCPYISMESTSRSSSVSAFSLVGGPCNCLITNRKFGALTASRWR